MSLLLGGDGSWSSHSAFDTWWGGYLHYCCAGVGSQLSLCWWLPAAPWTLSLHYRWIVKSWLSHWTSAESPLLETRCLWLPGGAGSPGSSSGSQWPRDGSRKFISTMGMKVPALSQAPQQEDRGPRVTAWQGGSPGSPFSLCFVGQGHSCVSGVWLEQSSNCPKVDSLARLSFPDPLVSGPCLGFCWGLLGERRGSFSGPMGISRWLASTASSLAYRKRTPKQQNKSMRVCARARKGKKGIKSQGTHCHVILQVMNLSAFFFLPFLLFLLNKYVWGPRFLVVFRGKMRVKCVYSNFPEAKSSIPCFF